MKSFPVTSRVILAAVATVALAVHSSAADGSDREGPGLLPKPQQQRVSAGRFVLRDGLRVVVSPAASARVREIADLLREELRSTAGIAARIETSNRDTTPAGAIRLVLAPSENQSAANPEGYTVRVGDEIEVRASDPRGLLWGVQTLLQGIAADASSGASLARGEIVDAPAYAWRAVMLDPVRSFLDLDFIRRMIRVMSAYKLNILHLHLIDDHAWRFESKAFPRCNPAGELYYTQAELKELVAFAQRYGVEIIPEFDFPGHARAAVAAYPDLDCEGKVRPMDEAIFCAGKPFTWEFMAKVIAEAAAIFPSPYVHLGADEPFAVKRWETCPHCQARAKDKGVAGTPALYHTFVADLDALVKRQGKRMIVWNDAIHPGVEPMPPKDILIDAWTDYPGVKALAEAGYTIVNSSNRPLYLTSYGQRTGFPLSAVWQWTPRIFGLREARSSDADLKSAPLPEGTIVLGGQACAWATDQRITERRLYPRLLVVAETLWSGTNRGDYADFSARSGAGQMAWLRRLGVPDDGALPVTKPFAGKAAADAGFVAQDGGWRVPAGSATTLSTKESYRDFILTFERRASENTGETGFFIRCSAASPDGFRIRSAPPPGMRAVAGDVKELKGWNRFELIARGPVVSLTINDYLAWSVTDPAPRPGSIVLTADGKEFEVRNVELRSLDAGPR